ncbi:ISC system 2Fe-2S type ferredoxin [Derxia gummosa]|uniref:2Fe-2S ferredoxin n=1 Tax=Derxia gummosa DSM 723 TaxID=1121388 RepID=A0A8B6X1X7_9BURK|nr:ISC system 2Fe-2S type ferredoxin [Derxia gummosa]
MPIVKVLPHPDLCPEGASFDVKKGKSLVDALLANGIEIEHACEKVCACATCHVHIRQGKNSVKEADDEEEDELDNAWGLDPDSRLACCVKLGEVDLVVELPKHTRNLAREH